MTFNICIASSETSNTEYFVFLDMSNIKLFESKQIRTVWNEAEQKWYFAVADVVQILTGTPNPTDYIKKMRKRDELLSQGWGQLVTPFWLTLREVNKNFL